MLLISVSRDGVYFNRLRSPLGLNAQLCCARFAMSLFGLCGTKRNFVRYYGFRDVDCSVASAIDDILLVKGRQAEIPIFCSEDISCIIESLCVL